MKLLNIPYYCGGRLLVGLYDDVHQGTPEQVFNKINREQESYDARDGDAPGVDNCPYIPRDLLLFQQFLKRFLHVEQPWGMQGMILAITNRSQKMAEDFLIQSGFEISGRYNKGGSTKGVDPAQYINGSNTCNIWIGNYFDKVMPILKGVPDYEDKTTKAPAKFG